MESVVISAGFLYALLYTLVTEPPILVFKTIRRYIRRVRFPYNRAALLEAITAFHPPGIAAIYYGAVIDGYFENAPWLGSPRWSFFNQPLYYGRVDGGELRRGEIELSAIPTKRGKLVLEEQSRFSKKQTSYDTPWKS